MEKPGDLGDEEVNSCHSRRLRRVHIKEMDPSMLIAFLIRSEDEWRQWRRAVQEVQGKAVIHVTDHEPALHDERDSAIDEVEALDEDEEDTFET